MRSDQSPLFGKRSPPLTPLPEAKDLGGVPEPPSDEELSEDGSGLLRSSSVRLVNVGVDTDVAVAWLTPAPSPGDADAPHWRPDLGHLDLAGNITFAGYTKRPNVDPSFVVDELAAHLSRHSVGQVPSAELSLAMSKMANRWVDTYCGGVSEVSRRLIVIKALNRAFADCDAEMALASKIREDEHKLVFKANFAQGVVGSAQGVFNDEVLANPRLGRIRRWILKQFLPPTPPMLTLPKRP